MALSDVKVRNAKPTEKQFKLFDGDGLFLLVTPNGKKGWRFKYRFEDVTRRFYKLQKEGALQKFSF